KLDALIDSSDARGLVRATFAEDLYLAVLEVGLNDALEIVQLASPTQFRTFVDLAAWQKDRVDPQELLAWLRAANGDDTGEALAKVHALDPELLELLFRRCTTLYDLEETPDANPRGVYVESAEGKYLIELHAEGADLATLKALIATLTAEDP